MPWSSKHINWLKKKNGSLITGGGKKVEVWEFQHTKDKETLSAWAKHFRNHYCLDTEIEVLRDGTGLTKKQYLEEIKFPDKNQKPGPSIRSGDFAELLVADYLQFILGYFVPRTRYGNKAVRDESTKGCDVLGFKFFNKDGESPKDILAIFEAKAQLTGKYTKNKLQEAINGSVKDQRRKAESLNAMKQRLIDRGELPQAEVVSRFQNKEDNPYKEISGAAALFTSTLLDDEINKSVDTSAHPNSQNLSLLVIHGKDMMALVHDLYEKAANEA